MCSFEARHAELCLPHGVSLKSSRDGAFSSLHLPQLTCASFLIPFYGVVLWWAKVCKELCIWDQSALQNCSLGSNAWKTLLT